MKKIKTLTLSLGAVVALSVPAVIAISCGSEDAKPNTNPGTNPDGNQAQTVTLDVSNKSVEQTIDALVKELHVNMDAIGTTEDAWTISDDNAKVVQYMNQITVNKKIKLTNGADSYTLDFTPIQQWVTKIKEAASQTVNPNHNKGSIIGLALMSYGMPEIAVLTNSTLGTEAALAMGEFMELSTDDFSTMTNKDLFFDNHGYIQMLKAYHTIIWDFTQSNFYKTWITGKQFILIDNGAEITVDPGQKYDDPRSISFGLTQPPRYDGVIQTTNFEAEFGLRLLNGFEYNRKINQAASSPFDGVTTYVLNVQGTQTENAHFDQAAWDQLKSDFPDFSSVEYHEDIWGDMDITLPTGWHKADFEVIDENTRQYVQNPDLSTITGNIQFTSSNSFLVGHEVYWKA